MFSGKTSDSKFCQNNAKVKIKFFSLKRPPTQHPQAIHSPPREIILLGAFCVEFIKKIRKTSAYNFLPEWSKSIWKKYTTTVGRTWSFLVWTVYFWYANVNGKKLKFINSRFKENKPINPAAIVYYVKYVKWMGTHGLTINLNVGVILTPSIFYQLIKLSTQYFSLM